MLSESKIFKKKIFFIRILENNSVKKRKILNNFRKIYWQDGFISLSFNITTNESANEKYEVVKWQDLKLRMIFT